MRGLIPPLLLTALRLLLLGILLWVAALAVIRTVRPPAPAAAVFTHSDTAETGPAAQAAGGTLRVNTAGADALQTLPGIGEHLAEQIVRYREEHGPFRYPEDLLRVPGIGSAKLHALLPYITLETDAESKPDASAPDRKEGTP